MPDVTLYVNDSISLSLHQLGEMMNVLADTAVVYVLVSTSIIADVTAVTQVKMMLEKSREL